MSWYRLVDLPGRAGQQWLAGEQHHHPRAGRLRSLCRRTPIRQDEAQKPLTGGLADPTDRWDCLDQIVPFGYAMAMVEACSSGDSAGAQLPAVQLRRPPPQPSTTCWTLPCIQQRLLPDDPSNSPVPHASLTCTSTDSRPAKDASEACSCTGLTRSPSLRPRAPDTQIQLRLQLNYVQLTRLPGTG
jgi:hypothetical protein